jgi:hypothetical protein
LAQVIEIRDGRATPLSREWLAAPLSLSRFRIDTAIQPGNVDGGHNKETL